jgi:hypothetical protein
LIRFREEEGREGGRVKLAFLSAEIERARKRRRRR